MRYSAVRPGLLPGTQYGITRFVYGYRPRKRKPDYALVQLHDGRWDVLQWSHPREGWIYMTRAATLDAAKREVEYREEHRAGMIRRLSEAPEENPMGGGMGFLLGALLGGALGAGITYYVKSSTTTTS